MIRKLELLIVAVVLVVAAFSTALPFLFYLLYLAILVIGGSYVLVRLGLTDLEAGYAVSQLHGHVGDRMRVTYTLRNASRIPKLWLEIHNPTTLPGGLPGRAITLAGRTERSWLIRAPLSRRGHFRVEPLHIRTGDPFGFFEASATVGQGISIVVYPRIEPLPRWRLPAAALEGSHASPVRTLQTTPMATSVRPYAPGDAHEPDPLEDDGPPRRDPGQGVRPRADGRRLDHPRPPARDPDRSRRRVDGRGGRPRRGLDRRQGAPGEPRGRADRQRRPDGVPATRPRRPAAPQDHAAPGRRRSRRQCPARRDADRTASGGCAAA